MDLDRRHFVLASAATVVAACCGTRQARSANAEPSTPATVSADGKVVDAGPLAKLKTEKVYDGFREQGFFVIRRDKKVFALSSVCTHKGCKVRAQEDGSFLCRCHKSTFDADGRVTKGPATRDLPRLPVADDERNHLLVKLADVEESNDAAAH